MSREGKAGAVWKIGVLTLAVVAVLGFGFWPWFKSAYVRYEASSVEVYCKTVLNGVSFPDAKSDDYGVQLAYCEHVHGDGWQTGLYCGQHIRKCLP